MIEVKYGRNNRVDVGKYVVNVFKHERKYHVSVLDSEKLEIITRIYEKREYINNMATQYGVRFIFS